MVSELQLELGDTLTQIGDVIRTTGGPGVGQTALVTSIRTASGIRYATITPPYAVAILNGTTTYSSIFTPSLLADSPGVVANTASLAANSTLLTAIKTVTDKLAGMLSAVGGGLWQFTASALGLAPAGGGSARAVMLVQGGLAITPDETISDGYGNIIAHVGDDFDVDLTCRDESGALIPLDGWTATASVADASGALVGTVSACVVQRGSVVTYSLAPAVSAAAGRYHLTVLLTAGGHQRRLGPVTIIVTSP
jgi:hypothetical protein